MVFTGRLFGQRRKPSSTWRVTALTELNNFGLAAYRKNAFLRPSFPGSYHEGAGHQFSVGLEGGDFVADIFEAAHGDIAVAGESLSRELGVHARALETIGVQFGKRLRLDLYGDRCHLCPQWRLVHCSGD